MQRDMKIGMALGLALIGIVGALFFRREPETKKDVPPPLQSAQELDRQIAEKAKPPYIKGLEDFADAAASAAPQSAGTGKTAPKNDAYDVPSFLNKGDETENRELLSRKTAAAPDPIQTPPAKDSLVAGANGPAHNRDWEPTGTALKPGDGPRDAGAPATAGRTHVIRAGETLSGLAARYLGSTSRYREIYEANRGVLRSADDLPDGVTIVIPEGKPRDPQRGSGNPAANQNGVKARKAIVRTPAADDDRRVSEASSSGDAPREKIRFVPVHRGPFSAGRVTPSSRVDSDSRRKAGASGGNADDNEP